MLVIISDLHLTDGSTCETISAGAFRQFVNTLSEQAEAACWRLKPGRTEGVFELLERVDVLLLGDILDAMRSDQWLQATARPWDDLGNATANDALADTVTAITRGILAHNRDSLGCFRDLHGQLPIKASHTGEHYNIPVFFHYLVGNHDWFYHLRGAKWDALRGEIREAIGLANDPAEIFPHRLDENAAIAALCAAHRLHVQHGDIFDAINYQKDKGRDASSLGDAIVIEILNGFPERVKNELGLRDDDPLYRAFKEADNIRPLLALPDYFAMASHHFGTGPQQKKIQTLWSQASDPFLELPFVRALDRPWEFDTVDALQVLFALQKNIPMAVQGQLAHFVEKFVKPVSYRQEAADEPDIIDDHVDFVAYGHTHRAEMVPLAMRMRGREFHQQVYVNSGTWRPIHEQTFVNVTDFPFVHFHVMTYAFFYKGDERFGRRFEMWQGSLG
jgi:UDP-2,3-diacylglucosamine pyrophosphatase LpxH